MSKKLTDTGIHKMIVSIGSLNKVELQKALKVSSDKSKDFRVKASDRTMYRNLAKLFRKELKGYKINPKRRKKNPETEVRELILYAENTYSLHNQFTSIIKNLKRKAKRGIYDNKKAAKLWQYWIDEAVKSYNKEFLTGKASLVQNVFTIADRRQAAKEIEAQERDEIFRGDNPVKKKGRKKRRTAKQIAATKKLVAFNKKRRGKKRVTKKKVARKNPKRKKAAGKSASLFVIFKCKGKSVYYLVMRGTKPGWSLTKGESPRFRVKKTAASNARFMAKKRGMSGWNVGVAPSNMTSAQIAAKCGGKT